MCRRLFFRSDYFIYEHITEDRFLSSNLVTLFQVCLDFYNLIEQVLQYISLTKKLTVYISLLPSAH